LIEAKARRGTVKRAPPPLKLRRARPGFAKASAGRRGFASGNLGPRSHCAARENTFAIRVSVSTSRGGAPQHHRSAARDPSVPPSLRPSISPSRHPSVPPPSGRASP
jgi:hypothetical protein